MEVVPPHHAGRRETHAFAAEGGLAGNTCVTGIEALIERIARDASAHMTAGPAREEDLARLEATLGRSLPEPYRAFVARLGGGIYYGRHEVFGPVRAMIHDIELLPPLTAVCRGLPHGVIPVHRVGSTIHFMDLRREARPVPVFSLVCPVRHPDFATFLREVVVPSEGPAAGAP